MEIERVELLVCSSLFARLQYAAASCSAPLRLGNPVHRKPPVSLSRLQPRFVKLAHEIVEKDAVFDLGRLLEHASGSVLL